MEEKMKLLDATKGIEIFIPNEIFADLRNNAAIKPPHIGLAYSYYYLATYLYQYCKHDTGYVKFTQGEMKKFLGYNENDKRVNYLIKKDGILDQIGYTESTPYYPISMVEFDDTFKMEYTYNDKPDGSFTVKFPIKLFHRTPESFEYKDADGTIYEPQNTHHTKIDMFCKAMSIEGIQTTGFYIYSYIAYQNDWFGSSYCASLEKLSNELGISHTTITKYMKALEEHGFIGVVHQNYFTNTKRHTNEYVALNRTRVAKLDR